MKATVYTIGTRLIRRRDGATCKVVEISQAQHRLGTTTLFHVRLDDPERFNQAGGDMVGQASWLSTYFKKAVR